MTVKKMLLIASSVSREESSYTLALICKGDSLFSISSVQKLLDSSPFCIIIVFTTLYALKGDQDDRVASEKQPRQAPSLTAAWHLQPAPTRCDPSAVSGGRVLRCQRLGPGEIRDAATGPCGQAADFPSGQGVWFLPAIVLPSRIQFRAKRLVRIVSWEAGPEKRSQAHAESNAVRDRAAQCGTLPELRSIGESGAADLQPAGASSQHRATAAAGKKTPVSLAPSPTFGPADHEGLVAAYEELRRQFLNGQRAPGFALLLRGGMREWLNACWISGATPANAKRWSVATEGRVLSPGIRAEVILILAGILLQSCQESQS